MVPGTCLVVLVSKICRLQWCQEPVWLSWWQPNLRFAAAKRTGQNIDIKVLSEATEGGRDSVHCSQSRDTNIDKVCRSYRLSLEKITYLPCTVMGSWSTHTLDTILYRIFSSIKLNLLIFVKLFDQTTYVFSPKTGFG